jgi:hypothetical protein
MEKRSIHPDCPTHFSLYSTLPVYCRLSSLHLSPTKIALSVLYFTTKMQFHRALFTNSSRSLLQRSFSTTNSRMNMGRSFTLPLTTSGSMRVVSNSMHTSIGGFVSSLRSNDGVHYNRRLFSTIRFANNLLETN